MRMWRTVGVCLALIGLVAGGTAEAVPITLQQGVDGYTGVSSARMRDNGLTVTGDAAMYVGDAGNDADNRFLLRFDLSSLSGLFAQGDGTLTLKVTQIDGNLNSDEFFDAYTVDPSNTGWARTTSSWNYIHTASTTPWEDSSGSPLPIATGDVDEPVLGGLGIPGEGYAAAPIDTINQASYAINSTVSIAIPEQVLQDWMDGTNAGLFFRERDERREFSGRVRFGSPALTLDVVPEPATLGLLALGGLALLRRRRRGIR